MIRQLFCDDGHLRTVEEQEAYVSELKQHKIDAIKKEINWCFHNGGVLVRRANTVLAKEDFKAILANKKAILSPSELRVLADDLEARIKHKKR